MASGHGLPARVHSANAPRVSAQSDFSRAAMQTMQSLHPSRPKGVKPIHRSSCRTTGNLLSPPQWCCPAFGQNQRPDMTEQLYKNRGVSLAKLLSYSSERRSSSLFAWHTPGKLYSLFSAKHVPIRRGEGGHVLNKFIPVEYRTLWAKMLTGKRVSWDILYP